jgi:hypothetical protein
VSRRTFEEGRQRFFAVVGPASHVRRVFGKQKQWLCCHDVHTRVDMTLLERHHRSFTDSIATKGLHRFSQLPRYHDLPASLRLALPQACTPVPTSLSISGHRAEKATLGDDAGEDCSQQPYKILILHYNTWRTSCATVVVHSLQCKAEA